MTHPANLDPLLLALVEKLPAEGQPFTTTEREAWVHATDAALAFLYLPEWSEKARQRVRKALQPHNGTEMTTSPLLKEAPSSRNSAHAVDDPTGAGSSTSTPETPTGAETASPTSPPSSSPSASSELPTSEPSSPSTGAPAPTKKTRDFTERQKAKIVRRCVTFGLEVVADEEQLAVGTLKKWMREHPQVVEMAEEDKRIKDGGRR